MLAMREGNPEESAEENVEMIRNHIASDEAGRPFREAANENP